MEKADSRRVKMTKRLLHDALLELLRTQPLEKTTVTDVCRQADVNRSTFYAYYRDVSQLLLEIEDDVLDHLPLTAGDAEGGYSSESYLATLESFCRFVQSHDVLFKVLFVQNENSGFYHRLVDRVTGAVLGLDPNEISTHDRLTLIYSVNGVVGILKEWIGSNFSLSAQEFALVVLDMCYRTFQPGREVKKGPTAK